jgi:putative Mn2+ efflux pump MntP
MNDEITQLKEEEKVKVIDINKEMSAAEQVMVASPGPRQQRATAVAENKNWVGGVILIAIGLIFLVTNLGGFRLDNWWALFILIPAISNFGSAWGNYQANGRFTKSGRGSITGGLILSLIAFTFLFNWSWSVIWPVFLIIGGISALLGGWFD